MLEGEDIRDVVPVIIEHVGHEFALLSDHLHPVQVVNEGVCIVPPRYLWVYVRAGKILLSGQTLFLGRAGEGMEIGTVQAGADFMVESGFLVAPQCIVPMRADGGERLGTDDLFAVDVCGRGSLFQEEAILRTGPVGRRRPKFAHHDVAVSVVFDSVQRTGMRTGRFGLYAHSVSMGVIGKTGVVVYGHEVGEGLAEIGHEGIGFLDASYNMTGNQR